MVRAILSLEELRELTLVSTERQIHSPLGRVPYILMSRKIFRQLRQASYQDWIVRYLASAPCPVIGVGADPEDPEILAACDVVVESEADLVAILATIDHAPFAAMVLVQVLRATPAMTIRDALTLESLAYASLQAGPEFAGWLATRSLSNSYRPPDDEVSAILTERTGNRVSIMLNQPRRRNAISVVLRDALCEALELVVADLEIELASISGAGRCFSIGGALDEFGTAPDAARAHAIRSVRLPALLLSQCADRVEFRLHGACIGAGAELPAFSRRVLAAPNTFFQLPELRFGLIPGAGGCVSLPRRIGRHRTAYLALTGRRLSAVKALAWGLVDALIE